MEILVYILQILAIVTPVIIAVVAYLDRKSEKRQKTLQDAIFLILQGIECVGELSKCNAYELQKMDIWHPDTEKALKDYQTFHNDLKQFQNKIASGAL